MSAIGQEKVPQSKPRFPSQLARLIDQQGLEPNTYGVFLIIGEGRFLPGNRTNHRMESESGYLVTKDEEHYIFWKDIDQQTGKVGLRRWNKVQPRLSWIRNEEYLVALYNAKKLPTPNN